MNIIAFLASLLTFIGYCIGRQYEILEGLAVVSLILM